MLGVDSSHRGRAGRAGKNISSGDDVAALVQAVIAHRGRGAPEVLPLNDRVALLVNAGPKIAGILTVMFLANFTVRGSS